MSHNTSIYLLYFVCPSHRRHSVSCYILYIHVIRVIWILKNFAKRNAMVFGWFITLLYVLNYNFFPTSHPLPHNQIICNKLRPLRMHKHTKIISNGFSQTIPPIQKLKSQSTFKVSKDEGIIKKKKLSFNRKCLSLENICDSEWCLHT